MKTMNLNVFAGLGLAVALPVLGQLAVGRHTVDGGGGRSQSGAYALQGTIGQPDAGGPMTNGQYAVRGGFWVLPQAVQVPNAPVLHIAPAGSGQATVWWAGSGWILQESGNLVSNVWTDVAGNPSSPVTVPAAWPARYYRLRN